MISPRRLLTYLEEHDARCWCDLRSEYDKQLDALKQIAGQSEILRDRITEHQGEIKAWQTERQDLERRKGEDFQRSVQPLRAGLPGTQSQLDKQIAIRAHAFDEPTETIRERISATKVMLAEFKRQRRKLERSPEAVAARDRMSEIVRDTQMARLELVRAAF